MYSYIRKYLRRKFLYILVNHLFQTIEAKDLLVVKKGKMYVRGKPISEELHEKIRQDADHFVNSYVWDALKKDIIWHANSQMFFKGKTSDDLYFGKAMLYAISLMGAKIEELSK